MFGVPDGIIFIILVAVKVPFNTSSKREEPGKGKDKQPGPGAYIDIGNPVNSSVMKGFLKFASDRVIMEAQGIISGPFGSTEKRFKGTYPNEKVLSPGPGDYPKEEEKKDDLEKIYERIAKPGANSKSSMFSSKTDRFRATVNGDPFIQVVGKIENQYKFQPEFKVQSFSNEYQPMKQASPYYSWVNGTKVSFNSTAPRWKTHRIVCVKSPGPGQYSIPREMMGRRCHCKNKAASLVHLKLVYLSVLIIMIIICFLGLYSHIPVVYLIKY